MQEVLEFVLKNITTSPDDVVVTSADEGGVTNYTIKVNPEDVGRIIGKEGKVIKAIRTIMRVIAIQKGVRVRVSVLSGDEGSEPTTSPSVEDDVVTVEEPPVVTTQTEELPPEEPAPDSLSVEI